MTILSRSSPPPASKAASIDLVPTAVPGTPEPPVSPPRRRHKTNTPGYLQPAEIERLFKVITNTRDRAIFRIAYHAGLRASEVGLLQIRDYDPVTDRLQVHRLKGSHSGLHHLSREETRALRAWLKARGLSPGAIFCSRNGTPISRKRLDALIKHYGAAAGIPENLRHFHSLKHTCCTELLNRGFNIEQVQDWVGHARIQNTMIYGKVTNSRRQEMAAALKDWK